MSRVAKVLFTLVLALAGLLSAPFAYADVLFSQPDSSFQQGGSANGHSNNYFHGVTGIATDLYIYVGRTGADMNGTIYISAYSDVVRSGPCGAGSGTLSASINLDSAPVNQKTLIHATGSMVLDASCYYYLDFGISRSFAYWADAGGTDMYVEVTDVDGGADITTTRIIDIVPADGAVVSSSSPVTMSLHAYINEQDFNTFANFGAVNIGFRLVDQNTFHGGSPVLFGGQATTSGDFYFSTSTTLASGNYAVHAVIYRSLWGSIGNSGLTFDDQSHLFIVGTSTYQGALTQNLIRENAQFYSGISATSTTAIAGYCNPTTFDIRLCLSLIFIPPSEEIDRTLAQLHDEVLTVAPWGYITRMYDIFVSEDTVALPSLVIVGPPGVPFLGNININLDPWSGVMGTTSLLATATSTGSDPKTLRQIIEPGWNAIIVFMFSLAMFMRFLGFAHHNNMSSHRGKRV